MGFNLQKLRYERISRRIPQEDVAKELGLRRWSYHKREIGRVKISVDEFPVILTALGIPHSEAGDFF